jgi:hypothetical protein
MVLLGSNVRAERAALPVAVRSSEALGVTATPRH